MNLDILIRHKFQQHLYLYWTVDIRLNCELFIVRYNKTDKKKLKKNFKIIEESCEGLTCEEGGVNAGKLWKLKKTTKGRSHRTTNSNAR